MRTKFYRVLKLWTRFSRNHVFQVGCQVWAKCELNELSWIFFQQFTYITRGPDVTDFQNIVLFKFTAFNITKKNTKKITFWKRSRYIAISRISNKTLRQDLDELIANNRIFWIFFFRRSDQAQSWQPFDTAILRRSRVDAV